MRKVSQVIAFDPIEFDKQYQNDKEAIVRNWFFVGSELSRLKRNHPSTKNFGRAVSKTEFANIPSSDRSNAIWMFEHWHIVMTWIRRETGKETFNAFLELDKLNASHPAHIKRKSTRSTGI